MTTLPQQTASSLGDLRGDPRLFRPYFTAGLAIVLSVGAAWGVWLLWKIGYAGSFTGISIHEVNAHGHAQIFGWVGLFIMGFAYYVLPRFWGVSLPAPGLARIVLVAVLVGIISRTAGMMLENSLTGLTLVMGGAVLETAAITAFVMQLFMAFRRSTPPVEPSDAFLLAALVFFVVQTVFSAWHAWNTMTAESRGQLLWYVATYQAPLRDLQIHGMALCMIFGVSLRLLPAWFGAPPVRRPWAWAAWFLTVGAVISETVLFIAYRHTGGHWIAAGLILPWLALIAAAACLALPWRLWRPLPVRDPSGKFVRAAYAWLVVSLLMLLLLPAYQSISGIAFSHAYYGAVRHAVTVGFISLMMIGMAPRLVAAVRGTPVGDRPGLWGPFLLVNAGCLLRVVTQVATDWHSGAFHLVGVSGVLEFTGLAWWGVILIGLMIVRRPADRASEPPRDLVRAG